MKEQDTEPKEGRFDYPLSDEDIVCGVYGCRGYMKDKNDNYKRV